MFKSQRFSQHLKASLESQVDEVAAEEGIVEGDLENQLMAANESMQQLNDLMDEADDLSRASYQLESILNNVQAEEEGLDPTSAKFVSAAIESVTNGWGLEESLVPSSESFGGAFSRKEATASLEANVKGVIEQVIAFLKKMWETVKNFVVQVYNRLTSVAAATEQRAKRLKERAGKLTGAPKKAEVDITALAWRFSFGKATPGNLPASVKELANGVAGYGAVAVRENANSVSGYFSDMAEALANGDNGKFSSAYKSAVSGFEKDLNAKVAELKKEDVLPDGSKFEARSEGDKGEQKLVVTHQKGKGAGDAEVKFKAMSPSQIAQTASAVEAFAKKAFGDMKAIRQAKSDLPKWAKKSVKSVKKGMEGDDAKQMSQLAHRWGAFYSESSRIDLDFYRSYVSAAAAILSVAEKCAKAYVKGSDKKEEKKNEEKK